MFEHRNNINVLFEILPPLFYNVIMAAKFINGVVNMRKVKALIEKMKCDWNSLRDETEFEIMCQFYNSGRSLNIIYIIIVYFVLISYMILPLSPVLLNYINPLNESRPKEPLYMVEFYVNQDKYFYTILMHAYVTSLAGILPLFGSDTLLSWFIHHVSGMMTILGRRIDNVMKEKKVKSTDDEYELAVECVKQHRSIIEFCDDINGVYSYAVLVLITICLVLLSITGVATVMKLDESFKDAFRFAMFTMAQVFHMFCYNSMGQKLLNHGIELSNNIYNSDWYKSSPKTKHLINFMILRTSKPNVIQATIFPLSLESFSAVLKSAMSYFTVLKSSK